MSILTALIAAAALMLGFGFFYHYNVIDERRRTSRWHMLRFSPSRARCVYAGMMLAIGVLLWGFLQDTSLIARFDSLAIIFAWGAAVLSWAYLGTQLIRMLPKSIRLFRGWDASQVELAGFALSFQIVLWSSLALGAFVPFIA